MKLPNSATGVEDNMIVAVLQFVHLVVLWVMVDCITHRVLKHILPTHQALR